MYVVKHIPKQCPPTSSPYDCALAVPLCQRPWGALAPGVLRIECCGTTACAAGRKLNSPLECLNQRLLGAHHLCPCNVQRSQRLHPAHSIHRRAGGLQHAATAARLRTHHQWAPSSCLPAEPPAIQSVTRLPRRLPPDAAPAHSRCSLQPRRPTTAPLHPRPRSGGRAHLSLAWMYLVRAAESARALNSGCGTSTTL
jgi:hypothetical protein